MDGKARGSGESYYKISRGPGAYVAQQREEDRVAAMNDRKQLEHQKDSKQKKNAAAKKKEQDLKERNKKLKTAVPTGSANRAVNIKAHAERDVEILKGGFARGANACGERTHNIAASSKGGG